MSWLISILVALITGAFGLVLTGFIANACVSWFRISSFEGKAGYFVLLTALFGGMAACVLGLLTSRLVAAGAAPGFVKAIGCSLGVVALLAGLAALVCRALADVPPKIDGQELDLEVEFRLPRGETNAPAAESKWSFSLGSVAGHVQRAAQTGELKLAEVRSEQGRWIIPGSVFLFTGRGKRSIQLNREDNSVAGFLVPLPARPGKEFAQWSEWLPRTAADGQPWPDDKTSYRFRVVQQTPPAPPPDPAEGEAQQFSALSPEAPLAEWISFLHHDSTEERVRAVMKVVEARPVEFVAAIRSQDQTQRELALQAVPRLGVITPEISAAVLEVGRNIAADIRRFNALDSHAPDFHELQMQLRSRFNHWKRAWWTVQQRLGLDGRPPVQEIHDLAQVRASETSMSEIVVNARAILDALPPEPSTSP